MENLIKVFNEYKEKYNIEDISLRFDDEYNNACFKHSTKEVILGKKYQHKTTLLHEMRHAYMYSVLPFIIIKILLYSRRNYEQVLKYCFIITVCIAILLPLDLLDPWIIYILTKLIFWRLIIPCGVIWLEELDANLFAIINSFSGRNILRVIKAQASYSLPLIIIPILNIIELLNSTEPYL